MYRDAVLHWDFTVVITSTNGTLSVCQIAYSLHTIGLLPCVVAYTTSYLVRGYELRNREAVGGAIAGCALCTMTAPCFGHFLRLNWHRRMVCPACDIHILYPVQHLRYILGALHWLPGPKWRYVQVILETSRHNQWRTKSYVPPGPTAITTITRSLAIRAAGALIPAMHIGSSRHTNLKSSLVTGRNRRKDDSVDVRYCNTVTP